jgi:hypothetical protein
MLGVKKEYDIIMHNNKNFEHLLLERYFLIFVESCFSDRTLFHPINKVDYKDAFLASFSQEKLITSLQKEWFYGQRVRKMLQHDKLSFGLGKLWVLKKLYNTWRYHDTILELIATRNISSFSRCNDLKRQLLDKFRSDEDAALSFIQDLLMENYYHRFHKPAPKVRQRSKKDRKQKDKRSRRRRVADAIASKQPK